MAEVLTEPTASTWSSHSPHWWWSSLPFLCSRTSLVSHLLLPCPPPVVTYVFSFSSPLSCSQYSAPPCFSSPDSHYLYGSGLPADSQAVCSTSPWQAASLLPYFWLTDGPRFSLTVSSLHYLHFLKWPLPFSFFKSSPEIDNPLGDITTTAVSFELEYLSGSSKLSCSGRTPVFPQKPGSSNIPHF